MKIIHATSHPPSHRLGRTLRTIRLEGTWSKAYATLYKVPMNVYS